jgi:uncharacterized delta-60 repeat protein
MHKLFRHRSTNRKSKRLGFECLEQRRVLAGQLDSSFGTAGKTTTAFTSSEDWGRSVLLQPDGKYVVAGHVHVGPNNEEFGVARYLSNGTLDTTFGSSGKFVSALSGTDDHAYTAALQPDGKILVAGSSNPGAGLNYDFQVIRLTSSGQLDTGFAGDGSTTVALGPGNDQVQAIAVQADGKILLTGEHFNGTNSDMAIVRLLPDGTVDTSYGSDGKLIIPIGTDNDFPTAMRLQADGKAVVVGTSTINGTNRMAVVRVNDNGTLDSTFGDSGKAVISFGTARENAYGLAIRPDGKILVGGSAGESTNYDFAIARLTSAGVLDTTFGTNGTVTTAIGSGTEEILSLSLQFDGKILATGYSFLNGNRDFAVVRYSSNGAVDSSFDTDGIQTIDFSGGNDVAYSSVIVSTTKLMVAGHANNGSNNDFGVARLILNNAPTSISLSNASVAENSPLGTVVGTFSTSDINAGDTFTYTLVGGTGSADNSRFVIDGDTLKTNSNLNFEQGATLSVRVRSWDPLFEVTESVFTISLINLADNQPNQINVAIVNAGIGGTADAGFTALAAQLNDDSYFNFNATVVTPNQADSLVELAAYDVVIIGNAGNSENQDPFNNSTFANALSTWVNTLGGGLVASGYTALGLDNSSFESVIDALVPISGFGGQFFNSAGTISTDSSHPVTNGVGSFNIVNAGANLETPINTLDVGATQIGTTFGNNRTGPAVVVTAKGNGRSVYLAPSYVGSFLNGGTTPFNWLRSGAPDRLVEQAVAWASSNPVITDSSVTVSENASPLSVIATVNTNAITSGTTLNYTITSGNTGDVFAINSAGQISLSPGKLLDFEQQSSYSLTVMAIADDASPRQDTAIVNITVTDGPPSVTLEQAASQQDPTISGPILFNVEFSDVVTGFSADDVSFAGSTAPGVLTADVTGSGSSYVVSVSGMTGSGIVRALVLAGAASDTGQINPSLESTSIDNEVVYDVDSPSVATASFVTSGTLPANATSLTLTFSELVVGADSSANYELRRAGADGLLGNTDDPIVTISSVTVSGNTATLNFGALPEDVYRLTVKDTITDAAGNALDGDSNGSAGGDWRKDFVVGALTTSLTSPNGFFFDPEFGGFGAGHLVQGTENAFDGLGRLQLSGSSPSFPISESAISVYRESSTSSSTILSSGTWTDVAGLTSTLIIDAGAAVQLMAQLRATSGSAVRFLVNGVPLETAGNLTNVPITSTTVTVNPPATLTSSAGLHSHGFDTRVGTMFLANGQPVSPGDSNNYRYFVVNNTGSNGEHQHSVDIASFQSGATGAQFTAEVEGDITDWTTLAAGTYTISVQVLGPAGGTVSGKMQIAAFLDQANPSTIYRESSTSSSTTLSSGTWTDVAGLTSTLTIDTDAAVQLMAQLRATSGSAVRFLINGVPLETAGNLTNIPITNTTVTVNPPATLTSSAGLHSHGFDTRVGTMFLANGQPVSPGDSNNYRYFVVNNTGSNGEHQHSVDIASFQSGATGAQFTAEVEGDITDWTTLAAGTYTISVQVLGPAGGTVSGKMQIAAFLDQANPSTIYRESSTSSSTTLSSGTWTDVAGLTSTLTIDTDAAVQLMAQLRATSGSAVRFLINGVPLETSGNLTNIPITSTTVTVNPPATLTSSAGLHSHGFDTRVGTMFLANGQPVSPGDFNNYRYFVVNNTGSNGEHQHSVDIASFQSGATGAQFTTVVEGNITDWTTLEAGTYTISVQVLGPTGGTVTGKMQTAAFLNQVSIPLDGRSITTLSLDLNGLEIDREIFIPTLGTHDFARTVDTFTNSTGSSVTTPVRIVGNLGSDAATTVFATSDGDLIVEPTDLWFGTDDGDGTGTPAIIHLLHGPFGLQPTSVNVIEDNVEWTYDLTVPAGATKRLAYFTVLGTTRAEAIAAANALVTPSGFGGEAAAFLTTEELASIANFQFGSIAVDLVNGDLVLNDSDETKSNSLTVSLNGANVIITDLTESFQAAPVGGVISMDGRTITVPRSLITGSILIHGAGGDDTLSIDFSGGTDLPDIFIDGGPDGFDSLEIIGGEFANITKTFTNANDGSVSFSGGSTVVYTGLEPVLLNVGSVNHLIFNLPVDTESNATLANDDTSLKLNGVDFEDTTFPNPTGSLTINRGNVADTLTIGATVSNLTSTLIVGSGSLPLHTILVDGALALLDKDVSLFATQIAINATIHAEDITLDADTGSQVSGGFVGVLIAANVIGSGEVSVSGRGGDSGGGQIGVSIVNEAMLNGATTIVSGVGGDSIGGDSYGVLVAGPLSQISSSSGAVYVQGQGGGPVSPSSDNNFGVFVVGEAVITSHGNTADASVTVIGTGGNGAGDHGVFVVGEATAITSTGGEVLVEGYGGTRLSSAAAYGVFLIDQARIDSSGSNASVTVKGSGGKGSFGGNHGVTLFESQISSGGGDVWVEGLGGERGGDNHGVSLESSAIITSGGPTGSVTVNGTGGTSTDGGDSGVSIDTGSMISSAGGAVVVEGTGGSGTEGERRRGVAVLNASAITNAGTEVESTVTVIGHGGTGTGDFNAGVFLDGFGVISSILGAIVVEGHGGGTGTSNFNHGVLMEAGEVGISSTDPSTSITVRGFGGITEGNFNSGVDVWSVISSTGGTLLVEGSGGGVHASSENHGVRVVEGRIINTGVSVSSQVTVSGTGGNSAGTGAENHGVLVVAGAGRIASSGGSILVSAEGTANSEGLSIENNGSIQTENDGPILLVADSIKILGNSGLVDSGSGTTTIMPRTAGTAIDLGGADVLSGGSLLLGLSETELDKFVAGTLIIGRTDIESGAIAVTGPISPGGVANLSLISVSGIDGSGSIDAERVALRAETGIQLTGHHAIGNLSAFSTAGGIEVSNKDASLTVAGFTIDGLIGVDANNQPVSLSTQGSGNVTINAGVSGASVLVSSAGNLSSNTIGSITSDSSITLHNGGTGTLNGVLTGDALVKSGMGSVTLAVANELSGNTTVDEGVLRLAHITATGTSSRTIVNNGVLELVGGIGTYDRPLQLNNGSTFRASGGLATYSLGSHPIIASGATVTLATVNASDELTIDSGYQNAAGSTVTPSIHVSGPGRVNLYSGSNDFRANWNLESGRLRAAGQNSFGNPTASGSLNGSTLTLAGGTFEVRSMEDVAFNGDSAVALPVAVNADSTILQERTSAGSGYAVTLGALSLAANTELTLGVSTNVIANTPYSFSFASTTVANGNAELVLSNNGSGEATLLPGEITEAAPAALTKSGSGFMLLDGTNTLSGMLSITGGTLLLNGVLTSDLDIGVAGVLRGTGTINGNVSGTGLFSPGNSSGVMTINGDFTPSGTLHFDVNHPWGTPGIDYDQFVVSGAVELSAATLSFANAESVQPPANTTITVIENSGAGVTTSGSNLAQDSSIYIGSYRFRLSYRGGTGNDVVLTVPTGTLSVLPLTKVYDGQPIAVSASITDPQGELPEDGLQARFIYTYYAGADGTGGTLGSAPSSAGTYSVGIVYLGGFDYASTTESLLNFTIAPKLLTVAVTVEDRFYDGTTNAIISSRTIQGVIDGDDVSIVGGTANFDTPDVGDQKEVTVSNLALIGTAAGNYGIPLEVLTTASINIGVDETAPTSSVTGATLNVGSGLYDVQVTYSDPAGLAGVAASGVTDVDVFYRVNPNSGLSVARLHGRASTSANVSGTVTVSAPITAQPGDILQFWSVATDAVGNLESEVTPRTDYSIVVADTVGPTTQVNSAVFDGDGFVDLTYSGTDVGGGNVASIDIYVETDPGTVGSSISKISTVSGGANSVSGTLRYALPRDGVSHSYRLFSIGTDHLGNREGGSGALSGDPGAGGDVLLNSITVAAPVSPQVTGFDVNGGLANRSSVKTADLLFNDPSFIDDLLSSLNDGNSSNDRVLLERLDLAGNPIGGGQFVPVTAVRDGQKMVLNFGATGLQQNGVYAVRIDMDGNLANGYESSRTFHRLLGDTNGDGKVDVADSNKTRAAYANPALHREGDVDGDGDVDSSDISFFTRFLRSTTGDKKLTILRSQLDD